MVPKTSPVPDHAGRPLPPDADLFVPPPPEIGPVLSASTTLLDGQQPWPDGTRLTLSLGSGLLVFAVIAAVPFLIPEMPPEGIWAGVACGVVVGMLTAGGIYAAMLQGFTHGCRYVGRDGVARYTCYGRKDKLAKADVLRFEDAGDLWVSHTRIIFEGKDTGLNAFEYEWTAPDGRTRLALKGGGKVQGPDTAAMYMFAAAAERAWTDQLLGSVRAKVAAGGAAEFRLRAGGAVEVAGGRLRFTRNGRTEDCLASELDEVTAAGGVITFTRADARSGWLWSRGVFKVPMNGLANLELFLTLYREFIGKKIFVSRGPRED